MIFKGPSRYLQGEENVYKENIMYRYGREYFPASNT